MEEHRERELHGGENRTRRVGRDEVAELRIGAAKVREAGGEGPEACAAALGERDRGDPPTGHVEEPTSQARPGVPSARRDEDDMGRPHLEGEALEGLRGTPAGELSQAPHLPGVEGGVRQQGRRRIDEEHPRITAGRKAFEHRSGVQ